MRAKVYLPPEEDLNVAIWIARYNEKFGYSPNLREIGAAFGAPETAVSSVSDCLKRLVNKGYVIIHGPQRRRLITKVSP